MSTSAPSAARFKRQTCSGTRRLRGEAAPVRLENQDDPLSTYLLQSGLTGPGKASYPTHLAVWKAERTDYRVDGTREIRVPLTWTNDQGVTVTKTFIFRAGQYSIGLEYNIENHGDAPWQVAPYSQILRNDPRTKSSMFNTESRAYHGPAMDDGTKYRKLDMAPDSEDSHLSREVSNGWIAAVQHHFVSAIVPPKDKPYRVTMNSAGDQYLLATTGATLAVAPGSSLTLREDLYIGPELQSQLQAISPRLDRVADYGVLTILAGAALRGARQGPHLDRELGCGDHPRHPVAEAHLLSALRGERQIDGEDEDALAPVSRTCKRPTRTTATNSVAP